ncbi:type II toxin-antitoxin system ParD family antitoxin [Idiomarina sp.]|uniref:type II toxin-antitoxin system ParD family antitoxin n=1 Tax=Idiomarina sp. TaxID=1874361 RepID=UPI001D6C9F82|nr:type II toxin-antitoxin system ParD family antitoxin [Idiomarina sp.]MCJ8315942.1 type II toxin-antitoxin system ParD family antitoxin [Idiomarina sp.]NQZ15855.1 type II toxin-antitoxin system ParD family antitoxin [Idiomarina sp.]
MSKYFDAPSNNPQYLNVETLRQLLVEGEQSGVTEYDLESLINELDSEEKKSSAQ